VKSSFEDASNKLTCQTLNANEKFKEAVNQVSLLEKEVEDKKHKVDQAKNSVEAAKADIEIVSNQVTNTAQLLNTTQSQLNSLNNEIERKMRIKRNQRTVWGN